MHVVLERKVVEVGHNISQRYSYIYVGDLYRRLWVQAGAVKAGFGALMVPRSLLLKACLLKFCSPTSPALCFARNNPSVSDLVRFGLATATSGSL